MRRDDTHGGHSVYATLGQIGDADASELHGFGVAVNDALRSHWAIPTLFSRPDIVQGNSPTQEAISLKSGSTLKQARATDDLESRQLSKSPSIRRRVVTGWRAGGVTCTCTAAAVFITNTVLTIWASKTASMSDGIGTLIDGDCAKVKKWVMWSHLAINALGTLMLGASNYCMQYLSSPTREEVDEAHARGDSLDIGIQSVGNLKRISRARMYLWILLGLSSVPLHLIYNSAVFEALSANTYDVLVVTEDFLKGAPWDTDNLFPIKPDPSVPDTQHRSDAVDVILRLQGQVQDLERMDNAECIKAYHNQFLTGRRHLLAVTSPKPKNASSLVANLTSNVPSQDGVPYSWICAFLPDDSKVTRGTDDCDVNTALAWAKNSTWDVLGYPVEYCLSERWPDHCKLQFSSTIMIVVIVSNFLKLFCMLCVVSHGWGESLVTTGDAVASFLDRPDSNTTGICLLSESDVVYRRTRFSRRGIGVEPKAWLPGRETWSEAPSRPRRQLCFLLCIITLGIACFLFGLGLIGLAPASLPALWHMGFGTVNTKNLMADSSSGSTAGSVLANILRANTPQTLLSFLYLTYNGLFTCMLQADEWARYGHRRRGLRVSTPAGKQRATYYLTLPYTYAVPLLLLSGLLHWLVSQSFFLVQITVYTEGVEDASLDITTCGYSPIATLFVIIVGITMLAVAFGLGFRRYPAGIPLASSCSAAISAACHPPSDDVDAAVLPVQWGVIEAASDGVGHCSFTSHEVTAPVKGRLYT